MKTGTTIKGQLIADERFNTDILTEINDQLNNLCNLSEGNFIVNNLHSMTPRLMQWPDGRQYRIDFNLTTIRPMTRSKIYMMINKIRSQKLIIS